MASAAALNLKVSLRRNKALDAPGCASTVAANSHDYWQDGHGKNGRKSTASAQVARRYKVYSSTSRDRPWDKTLTDLRGVFMKYPG